VRGAARTAAALALVGAGAAADCLDSARIASLGLRDDMVLLMDASEAPFGLVRIFAEDAARIRSARSVVPVGGPLCAFNLFLIADGHLVVAREVTRL
jgi:hypothetical protein